MEIIDNLMICQLSINIDKFSITLSCLTFETSGPTVTTCGVSYMRHAVVKGLRRKWVLLDLSEIKIWSSDCINFGMQVGVIVQQNYVFERHLGWQFLILVCELRSVHVSFQIYAAAQWEVLMVEVYLYRRRSSWVCLLKISRGLFYSGCALMVHASDDLSDQVQ